MAQQPRKLQWKERCPHGLSASQFGMALGFCGRVSDYVHYLRHVVGTELEFTGNTFTAHGIVTEDKSRSLYELLTGMKVHDGGFFLSRDGLLGCSPDGQVLLPGVEAPAPREVAKMRPDRGERTVEPKISLGPRSSGVEAAPVPTTSRPRGSIRCDDSGRVSVTIPFRGPLRKTQPNVGHAAGQYVESGVQMQSDCTATSGIDSQSSSSSSSSGMTACGSPSITSPGPVAVAHGGTKRATRWTYVPPPQRQPLMRLLEIKSPYRSLFNGAKAGCEPFGIPQHYMCQIQGQMAIAGADECDFFIFLDGDSKEVMAWRVQRSDRFWAWAEPKLLQVVGWLRDGPPAWLDRSFCFEPFDFKQLEVVPLVFPFSISMCMPLRDGARFGFFERFVTCDSSDSPELTAVKQLFHRLCDHCARLHDAAEGTATPATSWHRRSPCRPPAPMDFCEPSLRASVLLPPGGVAVRQTACSRLIDAEVMYRIMYGLIQPMTRALFSSYGDGETCGSDAESPAGAGIHPPNVIWVASAPQVALHMLHLVPRVDHHQARSLLGPETTHLHPLPSSTEGQQLASASTEWKLISVDYAGGLAHFQRLPGVCGRGAACQCRWHEPTGPPEVAQLQLYQRELLFALVKVEAAAAPMGSPCTCSPPTEGHDAGNQVSGSTWLTPSHRRNASRISTNAESNGKRSASPSAWAPSPPPPSTCALQCAGEARRIELIGQEVAIVVDDSSSHEEKSVSAALAETGEDDTVERPLWTAVPPRLGSVPPAHSEGGETCLAYKRTRDAAVRTYFSISSEEGDSRGAATGSDAVMLPSDRASRSASPLEAGESSAALSPAVPIPWSGCCS